MNRLKVIASLLVCWSLLVAEDRTVNDDKAEVEQLAKKIEQMNSPENIFTKDEVKKNIEHYLLSLAQDKLTLSDCSYYERYDFEIQLEERACKKKKISEKECYEKLKKEGRYDDERMKGLKSYYYQAIRGHLKIKTLDKMKVEKMEFLNIVAPKFSGYRIHISFPTMRITMFHAGYKTWVAAKGLLAIEEINGKKVQDILGLPYTML